MAIKTPIIPIRNLEAIRMHPRTEPLQGHLVAEAFDDVSRAVAKLQVQVTTVREAPSAKPQPVSHPPGPSSVVVSVSTSSGGGGTVPNFADAEVPTDSGDHQHFTLAHAPSPAVSLMLFLNGLLLYEGAGNDYTLAVAAIVLASALSGTFTLLAFYRY